ncbi:MAG: response regulator [Desulfovibrionaceae bacterium]|jgi:DNA-binding response OmpR family regulator
MSGGRTPEERVLRVMLVDDEVGFLNVMQKRLSRRNLDVHTASCGADAIRSLREHRFDVVVVDLKMEDMDGIELLRILRLMDPDLPVLMLTGHGSEQAAREGMALGAVDYLTKPCDLAELVGRIRLAAGEEQQ